MAACGHSSAVALVFALLLVAWLPSCCGISAHGLAHTLCRTLILTMRADRPDLTQLRFHLMLRRRRSAPRARFHNRQARLQTASKGGVKSGRLGFELFDNQLGWLGVDEQVTIKLLSKGTRTYGRSLADVESALCTWSCFTIRCFASRRTSQGFCRVQAAPSVTATRARGLFATCASPLTAHARAWFCRFDGPSPAWPKTAEAMRLSAEQVLEEKLIQH